MTRLAILLLALALSGCGTPGLFPPGVYHEETHYDPLLAGAVRQTMERTQ